MFPERRRPSTSILAEFRGAVAPQRCPYSVTSGLKIDVAAATTIHLDHDTDVAEDEDWATVLLFIQ